MNNKDNIAQVGMNDHKFWIIIDTDSTKTKISSQFYKEHFKVRKVMKTSKKFTSYRQKDLQNCSGFFRAIVRAGMNRVNRKVYVIWGQAEALLAGKGYLVEDE